MHLCDRLGTDKISIIGYSLCGFHPLYVHMLYYISTFLFAGKQGGHLLSIEILSYTIISYAHISIIM